MRTARIIRPGVFYHVTSRVNHKEMLLQSPVAKDLFLEQLVRLRLKMEPGDASGVPGISPDL